jgi:hypothetical protein
MIDKVYEVEGVAVVCYFSPESDSYFCRADIGSGAIFLKGTFDECESELRKLIIKLQDGR